MTRENSPLSNDTADSRSQAAALEPQTAALLDQLNVQRAANAEIDIDTARAGARAMWLGLAGVEVPCQVEAIAVEGAAGPIAARLYRPPTTPAAGQDVSSPALPVIVFLHGGGWSMGDLDCYDALVRDLCARSGALIVSVDYRLAPEHKFPAGLEDGMAAVHWAFRHAQAFGGDAARIAIMGDSAGGNLATVIAHRLHNEPQGRFTLAAQFLIYPVLDFSRPHSAYPSRMRFGGGEYLLSRDSIDTTLAWYLGDGCSGDDPEVSPLLAENLSALPPTTLVIATCDPLADEVRRYAERLREAGVPTHLESFAGTIHPFLSFGVLDIALQAREFLAGAIRQQLFAN